MYAKLNTFILISLFNQDSIQEFPIQYTKVKHTKENRNQTTRDHVAIFVETGNFFIQLRQFPSNTQSFFWRKKKNHVY